MALVVWKIFLKQYSQFRQEQEATSSFSSAAAAALKWDYHRPLMGNPANCNNNENNQSRSPLATLPIVKSQQFDNRNSHNEMLYCKDNSTFLKEVLVVNDTKMDASAVHLTLQPEAAAELNNLKQTIAAETKKAKSDPNLKSSIETKTGTISKVKEKAQMETLSTPPILTIERKKMDKIKNEGISGRAGNVIAPIACEEEVETDTNEYCFDEKSCPPKEVEHIGNSLQRSKSRVRAYLKKCKQRLSGQHHHHNALDIKTDIEPQFQHLPKTFEEDIPKIFPESHQSRGSSCQKPMNLTPISEDCAINNANSIADDQKTASQSASCAVKETDLNDPKVTTEIPSSHHLIQNELVPISEKQSKPKKQILEIIPSTQHLIEDQLSKRVAAETGIGNLIDKYLGHIFPVCTEYTRGILLRQARDILVCSYHANLLAFESQFLCKFAEIATKLKDYHQAGEAILWREGWPLVTPTGELILHLGDLDQTLVKPSEIYLTVKKGDQKSSTPPALYAVWRTSTQAKAILQEFCIDHNDPKASYLSVLSLEMLNDELPQLLHNLIIGVERSIGRVSFNDLQMPIITINSFNQMQHKENNNNNSNDNNTTVRYSHVTNSPKCALKRSELITKNKSVSQRYMMRRLTARQDSMNSSSSGNSCDSSGSSGSSSNSELLNSSQTNKMIHDNIPKTNNSPKSISPALPLFCLGNSFPHIDSDEENMEEKKNSAEYDSSIEIIPLNSISDVPEKLLTAGIYLPGTCDLAGCPIITVEADAVVEAGLSCYEIATLLLFYSTIPNCKTTLNSNGVFQYRPPMEQKPNLSSAQKNTDTEVQPEPKTFTILIALEKSNHMCVIDYICQSLELLKNYITNCEILVACLEQSLLQNCRNHAATSIQLWTLNEKKSAIKGGTDGGGDGDRDGDGDEEEAATRGEENSKDEVGLEDLEEFDEQQQQEQKEQNPNNYLVKFISVDEVTTSVAPSQVPHAKLEGMHHHDARKWREFFTLLEPFQKQCTTAGERLVATMNDIRTVDLQGLPTRRQLYAQHRALSRTLMDSELHNLRKYGSSMLLYLEELAKSINNSNNHSNYNNNLNFIAINSSFSPKKTSNSNIDNNHNHNSNSTILSKTSTSMTATTAQPAVSISTPENDKAAETCAVSSTSSKTLTTTTTTIYSYKTSNTNGSYYGFNYSNNNNHIHSNNSNIGSSTRGSKNPQLPYKSSIKFSNDLTMSLTNGRHNNNLSKTSKCNNFGYSCTSSNLTNHGSRIHSQNNNNNKNNNNFNNNNNNIHNDINANMNIDVAIRLEKITLLFNEVDRAAKRLEQLTEQRRENLRELTRQRALEDEIAEVTSWITNDGSETLQRFSTIPLNNSGELKKHEQEFEKYYFISMKHLAKGRDLHAAAVKMNVLHESSTNLKGALDCFSEKLEQTREKIEGATRLHHLLNQPIYDDQEKQELQNLAENIGLKEYVEHCLQEKSQEPILKTKPNTLSLSNNLNSSATLPSSVNATKGKTTVSTSTNTVKSYGVKYTSTPARTIKLNGSNYRSSSANGSFETCNCWHESRNIEDMDELLDAPEDDDDAEEEQSKIADSGLGGCDRCEGNPQLSRICSCQSLNETENLYEKRHNCDELDDECYGRPSKHFLDIHSPIEANSHLQCHSSDLSLPKMEDISCLDSKIQKTLLYIMREMIGTERDYVRSLYYVIENYIDELLRDDIPQPLRGQRNVIFGNIEKIFEFHNSNFLSELERYEYSPLKVGAAFLQMESKFYLYALYNKNKPKSDTLMSEYGTAFFKPKQLELNDKMDLASYLLKPVQRMGKYALLLQQLVKACSSVEGSALQEIAADVEELTRAEEMVKFQLRHGNDLLAMDSLRDCDVNVKEQGRLLRQNEFLVSQGRGGKKTLRQVFLFEELVLFSKARRFPDHKNLDIYIYKNSIKTSDIGLTAHIGDSPTKFEIWFRKRKPEDTWTLQCMSEDIKNAWTEEISKLLWKQAKRNREIRLAEMSSMGIGSKPCLDIRPSNNQISDRSITISQLGKAPKLRHSFVGLTSEQNKTHRRPNSLISESSLSSGTSSSSISTGSSSGMQPDRHLNTSKLTTLQNHGLELINETQALTLASSFNNHNQKSTSNCNHNGNNEKNNDEVLLLDSDTSPMTVTASGLPSTTLPAASHSNIKNNNYSHNNPSNGVSGTNLRNHKRSTTLVSQLSMESGILSDISVTPDRDLPDTFKCWSTATTPTGAITATITTLPANVTLRRQKNSKNSLPKSAKPEDTPKPQSTFSLPTE